MTDEQAIAELEAIGLEGVQITRARRRRIATSLCATRDGETVRCAVVSEDPETLVRWAREI